MMAEAAPRALEPSATRPGLGLIPCSSGGRAGIRKQMFLPALDPVQLPFDKSQPLSGLSRKLPERDRKGIDRGGHQDLGLLPAAIHCPLPKMLGRSLSLSVPQLLHLHGIHREAFSKRIMAILTLNKKASKGRRISALGAPEGSDPGLG